MGNFDFGDAFFDNLKEVAQMVRGGPFMLVSWIGLSRKHQNQMFTMPAYPVDMEGIEILPGMAIPRMKVEPPPEEEFFKKPIRRMLKQGDVSTVFEHERGSVLMVHGQGLIVEESFTFICAELHG